MENGGEKISKSEQQQKWQASNYQKKLSKENENEKRGRRKSIKEIM